MPVMTDFLLTGCIGWDVLKLFWKKKRSPNPRHARKKTRQWYAMIQWLLNLWFAGSPKATWCDI
jgi:hypothetical protein